MAWQGANMTDKANAARWLRRFGQRLRRGVLFSAVLMLVLYATLALMVVPAPNPSTAREVSGRLVRLDQPPPGGGDMLITLEGGRRYYVNRANEVGYFAWERLLNEVHPGDTLYLTVVRPLAWRLLGSQSAPAHGPLAGVRTDTTTYMDAGVSARTWEAQRQYQWRAVFALALVLLCVAPDLARRGRGRGQPPAARSTA